MYLQSSESEKLTIAIFKRYYDGKSCYRTHKKKIEASKDIMENIMREDVLSNTDLKTFLCV